VTKVLLISADTVDHKMAGPGIRYWEMANALSRHGFDVTLAIPNRTRLSASGIAVHTHSFDQRKVQGVVEACDVFVLQGYALFYLPFLSQVRKPMVVDVYSPIVFENLENNVGLDIAERHRVNRRDVSVLADQIRAGDFFVCASTRQRDFWLGMLAALGRINPVTYHRDRSLNDLIGIVPFALPGARPRHTRDVLKGVWPGIEREDKVLLWGGGVWEWFDPLLLIRAVHSVAQDHPEVKLLFLGKGHPSAELNDALPMTTYERAVLLSKELGLYDRHVFFNDGWVPYEERVDYLLEADIGVSTHYDYVENLFSFRTRLLDYVWAGLPMVVSGRDSWSEEIVRPYGLGQVVAPGDQEGLARAIVEMVEDPDLRGSYRSRFERIRAQFTWERAVEPLAAFCQDPRRAADRAH
jgi:glycosyltransferase involved in cell wall biosynthesis